MSRVSQIPNIPRLNNPVGFKWLGERTKARRLRKIGHSLVLGEITKVFEDITKVWTFARRMKKFKGQFRGCRFLTKRVLNNNFELWLSVCEKFCSGRFVRRQDSSVISGDSMTIIIMLSFQGLFSKKIYQELSIKEIERANSKCPLKTR